MDFFYLNHQHIIEEEPRPRAARASRTARRTGWSVLESGGTRRRSLGSNNLSDTAPVVSVSASPSITRSSQHSPSLPLPPSLSLSTDRALRSPASRLPRLAHGCQNPQLVRLRAALAGVLASEPRLQPPFWSGVGVGVEWSGVEWFWSGLADGSHHPAPQCRLHPLDHDLQDTLRPHWVLAATPCSSLQSRRST